MSLECVKARYLSLVAWLAISLPLLAQDVDPQAPSLTQIIEDGGYIMMFLILLSFVAFVLAIYFLLTLRRGVLLPESFRQEAQEVADRGDVEALNSICRDSNAAGSRIIGAAARVLTENPAASYFVVRDVLEDEGTRQASAVWGRIQYLQDIAKLGPLIGLFGTVWGMIQAFTGIQNSTGIGGIRPQGLAAGVSTALVTTFAGLLVGIIATVLYSYFRGRANRVIGQMEESCNEVLQRFIFKSRQS